jgi:hypothetical protein
MEKLNPLDESSRRRAAHQTGSPEARGEHINESNPCGIVLLERPTTSIEKWRELQKQVELRTTAVMLYAPETGDATLNDWLRMSVIAKYKNLFQIPLSVDKAFMRDVSDRATFIL